MSKNQTSNKENITRKDALKKMGSYAAFAALGTMIILNPAKAQQQSGPSGPPGTGDSFGGSNVRGVRKNKNKK
tara:strand:- start:170 stop:388 length:219 start_codon:yes stop_codon:yes gene_type:complete